MVGYCCEAFESGVEHGREKGFSVQAELSFVRLRRFVFVVRFLDEMVLDHVVSGRGKIDITNRDTTVRGNVGISLEEYLPLAYCP